MWRRAPSCVWLVKPRKLLAQLPVLLALDNALVLFARLVVAESEHAAIVGLELPTFTGTLIDAPALLATAVGDDSVPRLDVHVNPLATCGTPLVPLDVE